MPQKQLKNLLSDAFELKKQLSSRTTQLEEAHSKINTLEQKLKDLQQHTTNAQDIVEQQLQRMLTKQNEYNPAAVEEPANSTQHDTAEDKPLPKFEECLAFVECHMLGKKIDENYIENVVNLLRIYLSMCKPMPYAEQTKFMRSAIKHHMANIKPLLSFDDEDKNKLYNDLIKKYNESVTLSRFAPLMNPGGMFLIYAIPLLVFVGLKGFCK